MASFKILFVLTIIVMAVNCYSTGNRRDSAEIDDGLRHGVKSRQDHYSSGLHGDNFDSRRSGSGHIGGERGGIGSSGIGSGGHYDRHGITGSSHQSGHGGRGGHEFGGGSDFGGRRNEHLSTGVKGGHHSGY